MCPGLAANWLSQGGGMIIFVGRNRNCFVVAIKLFRSRFVRGSTATQLRDDGARFWCLRLLRKWFYWPKLPNLYNFYTTFQRSQFLSNAFKSNHPLFLWPITIYVGLRLALEQEAYCCCMVTINVGILQIPPTRCIVNGDYYHVWFVTPVCEQTPRIFGDRQEKQTSGSTFSFLLFFLFKKWRLFPSTKGSIQ